MGESWDKDDHDEFAHYMDRTHSDLERHMEDLIGGVNIRMDSMQREIRDLKEKADNFESIARATQKLAASMEHMCKEQERQGNRLDRIEKQSGVTELSFGLSSLKEAVSKLRTEVDELLRRDGEAFRKTKWWIFTVIGGAVITGFLTYLFSGLPG